MKKILLNLFIVFIANLSMIESHRIINKHNRPNIINNKIVKKKHNDNGKINTPSFNDLSDKQNIINSIINEKEKVNNINKNTSKVFIENPTNLNYTYSVEYQSYDEGSSTLKNNYILNANNTMTDTLLSNEGNNIAKNEVFNIKIQINGSFQGKTHVLLNPEYKQILELEELSSSNVSYSIKATGILTCPDITLYENYKDNSGKEKQIAIGKYQVYNYYNMNFNWSSQTIQLGFVALLSGTLLLASAAICSGIMYRFGSSILNKILSLRELIGEARGSDILLDTNNNYSSLEEEQSSINEDSQNSTDYINHPLEQREHNFEQQPRGSATSLESISSSNNESQNIISNDHPTSNSYESTILTFQNEPNNIARIEEQEDDIINPFINNEEESIPSWAKFTRNNNNIQSSINNTFTTVYNNMGTPFSQQTYNYEIELEDAHILALKQKNKLYKMEFNHILDDSIAFHWRKNPFEEINTLLYRRRDLINQDIIKINEYRRSIKNGFWSEKKIKAEADLVHDCFEKIEDYRYFIRSNRLLSSYYFIDEWSSDETSVKYLLSPHEISDDLKENDEFFYINYILDTYIRENNILLNNMHTLIMKNIDLYKEYLSSINSYVLNNSWSEQKIDSEMEYLIKITNRINKLHKSMTQIEYSIAQNISLVNSITINDWDIDSLTAVKNTQNQNYIFKSLDNINSFAERRREIYIFMGNTFDEKPKWIVDEFQLRLDEYIQKCNVNSIRSADRFKQSQNGIIDSRSNESEDEINQGIVDSRWGNWVDTEVDPNYDKLRFSLECHSKFCWLSDCITILYDNDCNTFNEMKGIILSQISDQWKGTPLDSDMWEKIYILWGKITSLEFVDFY